MTSPVGQAGDGTMWAKQKHGSRAWWGISRLKHEALRKDGKREGYGRQAIVEVSMG